jgi:hypothetical protein
MQTIILIAFALFGLLPVLVARRAAVAMPVRATARGRRG